MHKPAASELARHWDLDPGVVYLNHGSFGACPREVLEAQRRYRDRMEREAVSFFCVELWDLLQQSRAALAGVVGGRSRDYVFLPNATTAVATILDNVAQGVGLGRALGPGDELLTTSHDYPACKHNLWRTAERTGAAMVVAPFPTPATHDTPISEGDVFDSIMLRVTERTKLVMLSHITSPSGVVLPIERICAELNARGVLSLVDGAHGPGAVHFDLPSLGASFYTSNCHKWLCTPKGVALLWVRPDLQERFRPLVLSNFAFAGAGTHGRSRYALEFDYVGTDDYTPMCAVRDALETLPAIAGTDWAGIAARNRALALRGRDVLIERLGLAKAYEDDLIGPLAMIELPRVAEADRERVASRPTAYSDGLQDALLANHGIQVPIWRMGEPGAAFDGRRSIRLSAQLYNSGAQYACLAGALEEELEKE
ncbi:MAG: aminotransferase class V-fold PLP-dependent enzyme [Phycisphaeraceae bacterium]|nr:MAG: aminotransferase class V-fold PLP-dependent enzyme [Phycisphaeraceae bacterium]